MTDPLRSDRNADAADVPERDREARIEELLCWGSTTTFLNNTSWRSTSGRACCSSIAVTPGRAPTSSVLAALNERQRKGTNFCTRAKRHSGEGMLIRLAP